MCGKRVCYEENVRFSVGHHGDCLGGSGFTTCFGRQPVSWLVALETMFKDSDDPAETSPSSHSGRQSQKVKQRDAISGS